MQLEYQAFGKIYGTQVTRGHYSPGVAPVEGGKRKKWLGEGRSHTTNKQEFCTLPPGHEGDCEPKSGCNCMPARLEDDYYCTCKPDAIASTRRYIRDRVYADWDKPKEIAEEPDDIAQECFLIALEEREKSEIPVCLCRLAAYKWKHLMINRGKSQQAHERTEGRWAIETQGKTKPESLWDLEAGQSFPAQAVVVDPVTTEHLLLRVEAEEALKEEKAYQLALIQEVAERVRRMHTGAVINYLMHEDDAPKVDRRIVHKEIEALQRDVQLIEEEREIKASSGSCRR